MGAVALTRACRFVMHSASYQQLHLLPLRRLVVFVDLIADIRGAQVREKAGSPAFHVGQVLPGRTRRKMGCVIQGKISHEKMEDGCAGVCACTKINSLGPRY
jgi:hypothetical protein